MKIFKLKLKTIRGSLAMVLPEELLLKFKVTEGDSLPAVETGGGFLCFLATRKSGNKCGSDWK